jgi:DNA polymerase III delta subunit
MPTAGAERLLDRLAKGQAPPVVVLLGADPYWRDLCRRKLLEALVPESMRDWAVTRFTADEASPSEVVGRAQMQPMLAPRQLLFVTEVEAWEKGSAEKGSPEKPKRKDPLAVLEGYFSDPAPFTVLVLEAVKLDQRTRFARLLGEHALVVELDVAGADPTRLALQLARERGLELDPGAAAALVEATAGRAARMAVELEKLACYAGESGRISAADVGALVVAEGSAQVWELAGLLAAGKRGPALELVDDLMSRGETAPKLVGALAWIYRKLVTAAEVPAGAAPWQAARQLGMRPEAASAAVEHAHRLSRAQLADSLMGLAEADDRLKSTGADDRGVMAFLMARLSRPVALRKGNKA